MMTTLLSQVSEILIKQLQINETTQRIFPSNDKNKKKIFMNEYNIKISVVNKAL